MARMVCGDWNVVAESGGPEIRRWAYLLAILAEQLGWSQHRTWEKQQSPRGEEIQNLAPDLLQKKECLEAKIIAINFKESLPSVIFE